MHLTLISPRIAVQKGDFLGSGVPYWPLELAILAAFLRERGHDVSLVDLFGTNPGRLSDRGDHYLQGAPITDFIDGEPVRNADAFLAYGVSYMSHRELLEIAATLRQARSGATIAALENAQAVTAYALPVMAESFFANGVDGLLCGEVYGNWEEIEAWLLDPNHAPRPRNVVTPASAARQEPLERLFARRLSAPVPAWDLVDLQRYWALPYSHGPKTRSYLPMLTSRGCPYPCDFCIVPETNDQRWRQRASEEVVDEILALRDRFGVRDFQIEDLNPTINSARWTRICELLLERRADIAFYLVSGTKAETVKLEQVPLLARAGCRYVSISPESGSRAVMKAIGKPFDYAHGVALVRACRAHGIRTQACFLAGHPAETEADHQQSRAYLREMVRAGLDEAAVFIVAPFAGSALHARDSLAIRDADALPSFSPRGRADFAVAERRRRELIRLFFREKLLRGMDLWVQGLRALAGVPQTKMENLPRRVLFVTTLLLSQWFRQHLPPRPR